MVEEGTERLAQAVTAGAVAATSSLEALPTAPSTAGTPSQGPGEHRETKPSQRDLVAALQRRLLEERERIGGRGGLLR